MTQGIADQVWDCVIVGGGASGLSVALTLGRCFTGAPMHQRTSLAFELGDSLADPKPGSPNLLRATSMPPSVAAAIAEGSTTAKIIVHDLLLDMFPRGADDSASSRLVA